MEDLRLSAVAARVVAWHNRHPLARRIGVSHIHAMGYVALPHVGPAQVVAPAAAAASAPAGPAAPEGGSLRERALARARQQEAAPVLTEAIAAPTAAGLASLTPDFSEAFIETLRAAQVARFAAKAGVALSHAPADGPVRQVRADGGHPGREAVPVYLLTAVVETGTRKSRVLLGTGLQAPVLGRRVLSTPRLAGAATLLLALVATPLWLLQGGGPAAPQSAAAVAPLVADTKAPPPEAGHEPGHSPAVAPVAVTPAAEPSQAPQQAHEQAPGAVAHAAGEAAAQGLPAPVPQHLPPTTTAADVSAPAAAHVPVPAPVPASAHAPVQTPVRAAAHAAVPAPAELAVPTTSAATAAPRPQAAARPPRHAGPLQMGSPSIRPVISEEAKAEARAVREAMAEARGRSAAGAAQPAPARPGAMPSPAAAAPPALAVAPAPGARTAAAPAVVAAQTTTAPTPAATATAPPTAAPPPAASAFALSTRPLRTRAEADQVSVAMRALLKTVGAAEVKVEVLPQGDDWRVVGMPFARRADADKARSLLVSRGMRIEVLSF